MCFKFCDHACLKFELIISVFAIRNEALRVAYIDVVETLKDGKTYKEFYSKLIKADADGNEQVNWIISLYFYVKEQWKTLNACTTKLWKQ